MTQSYSVFLAKKKNCIKIFGKKLLNFLVVRKICYAPISTVVILPEKNVYGGFIN